MDLSVFFQAADLDREKKEYTVGQLGARIRDLSHWEEADIIIMGNLEDRGNKAGKDLSQAADKIREKLYKLSLPYSDIKLADFGNLKLKESIEAHNEMFAYVLRILLEQNKRVLILGGDQSITYGQYLAYEDSGKEVEYVHIDSSFDLEDAERGFHDASFNHRIFLHKPNFLFNYSNLGYQRYFVSETEIDTLKSLNFSALRYGNISGNAEYTEPYMRTADMLSFDFSAVKGTEAPGANRISPGGFSAMEACQMARYAGLAYHLNSFSLSQFIPEQDKLDQTALLGAMMCWYFMDGHGSRQDDFPRKDRKNLRKYAVQLHASIEKINFFQHRSSGRWWMEVPYDLANGKKSKPSRMIACSKEDYEFAKGDDIPERWWLTYNKLEK
ncbi:MAG: arginase family protein [Bacteroidota bacterium]